MNHVSLSEVNAEERVGGAFENESCHKEKGIDFFGFFGGPVGFLSPRLVKGRSTPKTVQSNKNSP